ncbi:hypothetical protein VKT23_007561 [Stygiomarasmius scandens]|uniref:Heterokaryon incompatibility domain-containing protein n=1 Tax=Marasmiellus scandens TaxID=2682957 RepID=A0ABR1JMB7_9AGAR
MENSKRAKSPLQQPVRLVNARTLSLKDFDPKTTANLDVPPYAILSHRWLGDKEEVSYQEFIKQRPEMGSKLGFKKIIKACQQALRDNLEYIWIDTCCINQRREDELKRNIKSMYAFYKNSAVCYAYLGDITKKEWKAKPGSNWFGRGWTLQELVAPQTVVFFDKRWIRLGNKCQLKDEIHVITGIPTSVLERPETVHNVDIWTRIAWCKNRKTTKVSDIPYCLLGILDVSIEGPSHKEDVEKAFQRLRDAIKEKYGIAISLRNTDKGIFLSLVSQKAFNHATHITYCEVASGVPALGSSATPAHQRATLHSQSTDTMSGHRESLDPNSEVPSPHPSRHVHFEDLNGGNIINKIVLFTTSKSRHRYHSSQAFRPPPTRMNSTISL